VGGGFLAVGGGILAVGDGFLAVGGGFLAAAAAPAWRRLLPRGGGYIVASPSSCPVAIMPAAPASSPHVCYIHFASPATSSAMKIVFSNLEHLDIVVCCTVFRFMLGLG
jgi:hypothetical protein